MPKKTKSKHTLCPAGHIVAVTVEPYSPMREIMFCTQCVAVSVNILPHQCKWTKQNGRKVDNKTSWVCDECSIMIRCPLNIDPNRDYTLDLPQKIADAALIGVPASCYVTYFPANGENRNKN